VGPLELDVKEGGPFPCRQLCRYTAVPTISPLPGKAAAAMLSWDTLDGKGPAPLR